MKEEELIYLAAAILLAPRFGDTPISERDMNHATDEAGKLLAQVVRIQKSSKLVYGAVEASKRDATKP
jgi:hypothetical protein